VTGRAALFQNQTTNTVAVIIQQLSSAHVTCNDDRIFRQIVFAAVVLAHQLTNEAVRQIIQIMQALTQVRISLPEHLSACIALNFLNSSFRRQTIADRFINLPDPATVIGKHPVSFQNLTVLTVLGKLTTGQHVVQRLTQTRDRFFKTLLFSVRVLSDQIGNDNTWLMQNNVAKANAVSKGNAL